MPARPAVPAGASLHPAAVLVPLVERESGLNVVLTRRTAHLRAHAGQISFPGGRIEAHDESSLAAALREAEEEVGLVPEAVELVGRLPVYPTGTGFRIDPWVGIIAPSVTLVPDPGEVAEIFEVPLAFVLDPANHRPHSLDRGGRRYRLCAIPYGDYYIWGATAAILRDLYRLLADQPDAPLTP
ncbi:CoA pyrophosphatase [Arhodomonas sp. AD133]|uniref:CoA pyrophosphatase n=1 Tax=Arhodomonas sp. AD133 TaxID=3415009 RepID=UPI003EBAD1CB